jgi:hypothetical protein
MGSLRYVVILPCIHVESSQSHGCIEGCFLSKAAWTYTPDESRRLPYSTFIPTPDRRYSSARHARLSTCISRAGCFSCHLRHQFTLCRKSKIRSLVIVAQVMPSLAAIYEDLTWGVLRRRARPNLQHAVLLAAAAFSVVVLSCRLQIDVHWAALLQHAAHHPPHATWQLSPPSRRHDELQKQKQLWLANDRERGSSLLGQLRAILTIRCWPCPNRRRPDRARSGLLHWVSK